MRLLRRRDLPRTRIGQVRRIGAGERAKRGFHLMLNMLCQEPVN